MILLGEIVRELDSYRFLLVILVIGKAMIEGSLYSLKLHLYDDWIGIQLRLLTVEPEISS